MKKFLKYEQFINENKQEPFSELISMLFESRDVTHLFHLFIKSYAKHEALKDYYENIIDLVDRLAESYLGLNSEELNIIINSINIKDLDLIEYFTNLDDIIRQHKIEEYSDEICAILDEILELTSSTLYKIKNLN